MKNRWIMVIMVMLGSLFIVTSASAEDGLITKKSNYSVKETLDRLTDALGKKGIKVMARVDHTANAKSVNLTLRPTEVLIFGNPKLGTPLMSSKQTAGIDLPMKALAWQDEKGQVWLTYNDPKYLTGRHGIGDQDKVKTKMTGALDKLTSEATGN